MTISDLTKHIENKSASIGVVGLGYVGLPAACLIARAGFRVIGVDINPERITAINEGRSPMGGEEPGIDDLIAEVTKAGRLIATTDYGELRAVSIVIICVDTPIERETHYPSYRVLRVALASVGAVMAKDTLVVIESTIAPGTMTGVVIPELERASNAQAGTDFFLGHCPERVTPGLLLHNLVNMSRSVGGQTAEVAEAMVVFYRHFVAGQLDPTDMLTAEIVKTAENAYRDIQIAFANEIALVCEVLGANVYQVRELLNKSPGRNMLMPGAGVGGHCIPKDPWLLIANVKDMYEARLIPAARAVNDQMPYHVVELIERGLAKHQQALTGAKIAVLGYAFREGTDDDRDSPSSYLVEELRRCGAQPAIHDPYVKAYQQPMAEVLNGASLVVIMVAHQYYKNLDLTGMYDAMKYPIIVDGRNVVNGVEARKKGFTYLGIGNR